jgi:glycosyltransferase involved in cell wall biosynthesis
MQNLKDNKMTPLVSILCQAYNHGEFIEQCLKGIMMQETSFSFEVLVHDDASTDNTADIIKKFELQYPEIIKPIYQTENQFSQKKKVFSRIQLPRAKGKYIAICEGDDYWTDPMKLQKQVDFLEVNQEFIICIGKSYIREGDKISEGWSSQKSSIIYKDVAESNFIITNTVIFRNNKDILQSHHFRDYIKKTVNVDIFLFLFLLMHGKGYAFQEYMGVYRLHEGGIYSQQSDETKYIRSIKSRNVIIEFLNDIKAESNYIESVETGCLVFLERYLKDNPLTEEIIKITPSKILKLGINKLINDYKQKLLKINSEIVNTEDTRILDKNTLEKTIYERDFAIMSVEMLTQSFSWRITKPFRIIKNFAKNLF